MLRAVPFRRSANAVVATAKASSSVAVVNGAPLVAAGAGGLGEWVAFTIAKGVLGVSSTALGLVLASSSVTPMLLMVTSGFVMRAATLPLSIYGDRCVARIACALPQVQVAFQQYQAIANHPRAIVWEKKVAAQKMQHDRSRIFREHRTNNILIFAPHVAASVVCVYLLLGMPAQAVAGLVGGLPLVDAATSASMFSADPATALAATLTSGSCWYHLNRRVGFNDVLDAYVCSAKRALAVLWCGVCIASLVVAPTFLPPYIGPIWLGMSIAGLVKVAINAAAPLRFVFGIDAYPPEHGSYGCQATAVAHEYRLAVSSFDADEQYRSWVKAKTTMEFECDSRIYGLMKMAGIFNELEEFEFERERSRDMVRAAAKRRAAQSEGEKDARSEGGCADETFSTTDEQHHQTHWRRVAREGYGTKGDLGTAPGASIGYIRDESLAASMEAQLEEEKQRRIAKVKAFDSQQRRQQGGGARITPAHPPTSTK